MTGIELLRKYAETRQAAATCRQLPDALGKECDDFGSCSDYHRFVCKAIADQIELQKFYVENASNPDLAKLYESVRECVALLRGVSGQIERKTLPRPTDANGNALNIGDRVYMLRDEHNGTDEWDDVVMGLRYDENPGDPWTVIGKHGEAFASCCSNKPPILDADGVEIKVGDVVWRVEGDGEPLVIWEIDDDGPLAVVDDGMCITRLSGGSEWRSEWHSKMYTHKRPEHEPEPEPKPADTWERIEDDIVNKVGPCEYFGWSGKSCCDDGECPVFGNVMSCTESRASDIVRRCKALAGVE